MVAEAAAVAGNNNYGNLERWGPHGRYGRDGHGYDDDGEQCPEAMAWERGVIRGVDAMRGGGAHRWKVAT